MISNVATILIVGSRLRARAAGDSRAGDGELMDLARDLLDKLLVDRNQRPLGRVEGIVLELRADRPAAGRAAMEVGLVTAARRLHPRSDDGFVRSRSGGRRCR